MEESVKPAKENTTKIVMMVEQEIMQPPHQMEVEPSSASQLDGEGTPGLANHSQNEYEEGIIREHLPHGWNYMLKSVKLIKDIDEDGELQFEVDGRVNVIEERGSHG